MPQITIDGKSFDVQAGGNLLEVVLGLGLDLPYFCWHPAMGSVGSCRQCAMVQFQNAEDERGRIVMACMTPVTDGMHLSLSGERARDFRADVIEALMVNHPHDCPVCAEGGECHLQDMTVMSGHRERRYDGLKNTHVNQYLGPLINHEMNRCIACYRCVRYYQDYAGGTDLAVLGAHDHVYFGRHQDGVLESEFAGNLVEVCPTGVFTDKSLVHDYTRKWDLQSAPSVCVGCGVGCNTAPGERYGRLKRIHNRYHEEVNGYFLCDRGRFGGNFVNSDIRLTRSGQQQADNTFVALSREAALAKLAQSCGAGQRIAGIGSPRASLESNWMLQAFVGATQFCAGFGPEGAAVRAIASALKGGGVPSATLQEIEAADAVIILGEDVTQTAARVALALRQTVRNKGLEKAAAMGVAIWQDAAVRNITQNDCSPLIQLMTASTRLGDIAQETIALSPDDIARYGFALAHALGTGSGVTDMSAADQTRVEAIAAILRDAKRPLVISGSGCQSESVVNAARALALALQQQSELTRVVYAVPESNSLGLALLDDHPVSLRELSEQAQRGELDTLVVVENDLYRRAPTDVVETLLNAVPNIVVMDLIETNTIERASLALPVASFAECEGTLVNAEGRAQRYFPAIAGKPDQPPAWSWLADAAAASGRQALAGLNHIDALLQAIAADKPVFAGAAEAAPGAGYRDRIGLKVARQPARYSGRTAMYADKTLHEPKTTADEQSGLAFSMEGDNQSLPSALQPFVWEPGWNSNQSLHKFQTEVGGAMHGGNAGVRLIHPHDGTLADATALPAAFSPRDAVWWVTPQYRLFGSDELSAQSASVAELIARPQVSLSPADAARLNLTPHDGVAVSVGDRTVKCRVNQDAGVPEGTVGFIQGLPGNPVWASGEQATLERLPDFARPPEVLARDSEVAHG